MPIRYGIYIYGLNHSLAEDDVINGTNTPDEVGIAIRPCQGLPAEGNNVVNNQIANVTTPALDEGSSTIYS